MRTLQKIIEEEIPLPLRDRLIFLDAWEEPENFTKMTIENRVKTYYPQLKARSTNPTEKNHWVWLGEYRPPRFKPYLSGKSVVRLLYNEIMTTPLGNARLLPGFQLKSLKMKSDVNPFKYYTPQLLGRMDKHSKVEKDISEHSKSVDEQAVKDCMKEIQTDWEDYYSDPHELRLKILPNYDSPQIVDEAMKRLKLME